MQFIEMSENFGAERALALSYLLPARRDGVVAIWQLDARLQALALTTREAMLGRIKLQWWADQLAKLDRTTPPAEPVLAALALSGEGLDREELSALAIGWQQLVQEGEPNDEELAAFADFRGRAMFALMAAGDVSPASLLVDHGPIWALVDFAGQLPAGNVRDRAMALATRLLPAQGPGRLPRSQRAAGTLAWLARRDVQNVGDSAFARVCRMAWHRLSGY